MVGCPCSVGGGYMVDGLVGVGSDRGSGGSNKSEIRCSEYEIVFRYL